MSTTQDLGGLTKEEYEAIWGKEGDDVTTQEPDDTQNNIEDVIPDNKAKPEDEDGTEYAKLLAEYNTLKTTYETLTSSFNELNQKYKSYDGTYGKITGENATLRERISQLEAEIGNLSQRPAPTADADFKKSAKYQKWEELYGEEVAKEMMEETQTTVRQAIDETIAPIKNEWKKEKEDMQVAQQIAFNANLRVAIPDFDTINNSVEFIAWLGNTHTIKDEFDNDISVINKDIGERAIGSRNIIAVSNLIARFKKETGKVAPATKPQHIAPKATGAPYIPPQKQEINLNREEVAQFWKAYGSAQKTGYTAAQEFAIAEKYPAPMR